MNQAWQTELLQVAVLTFEELCFLFPSPNLDAQQRYAPIDGAVRVAFSGPLQGVLVVTLAGGLLSSLAANMLGVDEPPATAQQYDALGEIANVICGNVLPRIAGPQAVFQLSPPELLHDPSVGPEMALFLAVEVQLGLEHGWVDLRLFVNTAIATECMEA
jgi:CheY-specific phosphatase CheX